MTRLFSINITFHQHLYTALVSMYQQGQDYFCQVRYIDKRLQALIPSGRLSFNLSETLTMSNNLIDTETDELIACTNKAITEYLHLQTT